MASLLAAQKLALYLLSLLAVASAEIGWRRPDPLTLLGHAAGLAFMMLLGGLLADLLSGVMTAGWRRRARLLVLGAYVFLGFVALVAGAADARLAGRGVEACALLQWAALLLAEVLNLHLAALGNALVLVILAALAGGAPAAVSVTSFLAAAGFFLAFDHAARRLQARPALRVDLLRPVAIDAARIVLPLVAALAVAFAIAPPTSSVRFGTARPALAPEDARRAYEWLFILGLGGGGAVLGLARLFRGAGESAPLLAEDVETHVESEELLEPPSLDDTRYGAARGRIVRAYLRVLSQAKAVGHDLAAHLTPREIEARVGKPAGPLGELTALFLDARYGPDEPTGEAVDAAERAARTVAGVLARSPRPRRRRLVADA
jgi:uncharacterized protein DUF4129